MTTPQDPVSVRVSAGLYAFTFALSPDELDDASARARRCGLTFDAFVRQKMFGPDLERRLCIADDWPRTSMQGICGGGCRWTWPKEARIGRLCN